MESHAQPGTIQVTERTYERLRDRYELAPRGTVEVKGKGQMTTYLLLNRRGNQVPARPHVGAGVARIAAAENHTSAARPNADERDHRIR
jgi:Adenylate and Guanylate cyclase catalytic domain